MKKKVLMIAAAVLVLGVGVAIGIKKTNMNRSAWTENIEALCGSEGSDCFRGGPSESSCDITSADGFGFTCSISCKGGYACCGSSGCFCL